MPPIDELVTHHTASLPELRMHYVQAGEGPLVVLLHGFPQSWFCWRHQIPALARAGYRVVAPDLRGYGATDKPRGVAAYRREHLVRDLRDLIGFLGERRAHVVGHDWGAVVAWYFAMAHPERLHRLGILNVPHPQVMRRGLLTRAQRKKSWYIFAFQLPILPERRFVADRCGAFRHFYTRDLGRDDAETRADADRLASVFPTPADIRGPINYYRAARSDVLRGGWMRPIEAPTLVIWGEPDRYLGSELAEPPAHLVPNARVVRIDDASHWVQEHRPERVNELLIDFLR